MLNYKLTLTYSSVSTAAWSSSSDSWGKCNKTFLLYLDSCIVSRAPEWGWWLPSVRCPARERRRVHFKYNHSHVSEALNGRCCHVTGECRSILRESLSLDLCITRRSSKLLYRGVSYVRNNYLRFVRCSGKMISAVFEATFLCNWSLFFFSFRWT